MGLLDALFQPSTYGGQGGLLDRLIPSLGNYQSAGFPQQPDQSQATPMQVGGYQMPRIGNQDQFQPQQAMTPPNAQPTQGQLPQSPDQQQAPQLPPALGGNGFSVGNLGRAFNPDGLIARLTGNDSRSIAQQNLKAQYDSLVPMLGPQKALLAVMNPEAGKTLINEALTNKEKYGVISEDPLQGKQYGFINEREQTVNGKPIGAGGAPAGQAQGLQGMTDRISQMRESGASREQLLGQIPSGYREDVGSLIAGKGIPANMGRAQSRMAILTLAKVVDPNFDETLIPTRIQMRKDFAGEGKNGQAIGAFNTVQHHAGQVSDAIDEFEKAGGGSNYPILNAGKLMLANNTSFDPKLRDAAQKLKDKLNATEHEVAGAYNAGHITDADRKTWNEIKAENLPADQLKQKLDDFVELLNGKRDSLNHMYRQTFGEDAPTVDKETNSAITSKIHGRLPEYARSGAAPAANLPSGWAYKGSR